MAHTTREKRRQARIKGAGIAITLLGAIAGLNAAGTEHWPTILTTSAVLVAYFMLGFSTRLPGKTAFLIRRIPVIIFSLCGSLLVIAGLATWLARSSGLPDSAASPSQALQLVVMALTLSTLFIPYFSLQAVIELWQATTTRYLAGRSTLTFWRGRQRWSFHPREYHSLIISPTLLLTCASKEEEADALDHVNRPTKQRLFAHKLRGVLLADTSPLVRKLKRTGYAVKAEGRAWVVTPTRAS